MILTILGCGTSTGVPIISCPCTVCRSKDPKNKRLRAAAWVQTRGKSILIDTSVDLRAQALRGKIFHVDGVIYTHPHADHIFGIDELRTYNFIQKKRIPVFGNAWTCTELRAKFEYIFSPKGPSEGGGVAQLDLQEISGKSQSFDVAGISVIPLPVSHGSKECLGYRIDSVAYVTDCSYIPDSTFERMQGLAVLVLDCLRIEGHGTHLNLDQALEIAARVKAKKTFFTHMGHDFDYAKTNRKLPKGIQLAYDGLRIKTRTS